MKDPLRGVVVWAVPENKEVSVTLFKDARTQVMEDKEWTFAIEDVRRNFTLLLVLCMSVYKLIQHYTYNGSKILIESRYFPACCSNSHHHH
jgi:hypothetical protein